MKHWKDIPQKPLSRINISHDSSISPITALRRVCSAITERDTLALEKRAQEAFTAGFRDTIEVHCHFTNTGNQSFRVINTKKK